jgi:hypothetical protein
MDDAERAGRGPRPRWPLLAAGLAFGIASHGVVAQPAPAVTLATAVQARMGVATTTLAAVRHASEIDAFAKVLDPGPLAQLESDFETAEAAAAASKAEAARAKALHDAGGSVAAKDMEASQAQARSDALKAQILRQQFDLQWGPGVGRLSVPARRRLIAGLVKGALALVHVDTHNNEGQAGARRVRIDIGAESVTGVVIGPARAAEPRLQSSGLIVEVGGPSTILLSVGLTQSAHIEEATSQSGVLIPRSAVIRFRGSDWAYVRVSPTAFQRRLMLDPAPEENGLFVAQGFAPGDQVVTQGAAGLFAADLSRAGGTD